MPIEHNYAYREQPCPSGQNMPIRQLYAHKAKLCSKCKDMPIGHNYAYGAKYILISKYYAFRAITCPHEK
jgi:hypothetical protein